MERDNSENGVWHSAFHLEIVISSPWLNSLSPFLRTQVPEPLFQLLKVPPFATRFCFGTFTTAMLRMFSTVFPQCQTNCRAVGPSFWF